MGYSPRRLIKRSVLAMVLALGAIGVSASLNIPLAHAEYCHFTITATPGSQVVHPSYGEQATITASFSQSGISCVAITSIAIGWGDGSSFSTSSPNVTSYTASHPYPIAPSTTYYITVHLNYGNGQFFYEDNAAQVTVIGCPPACTPTRTSASPNEAP